MDHAAATPVLDYQQARNTMVDGQVRPNKVTDPRVLNAMRTLPRERFVPPGRAEFAYIDEDLSIGRGRFLMEPMVIARLVQMLRVRPGDRALVVGSGTGYGAALMAACGAHVTALEHDEDLIRTARDALRAVAPGVVLVSGPLEVGWPDGGPYDRILIEGAVRAIPQAVGSQLRFEGGKLVTVLLKRGGVGKAVLAEPIAAGGVLRAQAEFDCATPLLPSLRPAERFVF